MDKHPALAAVGHGLRGRFLAHDAGRLTDRRRIAPPVRGINIDRAVRRLKCVADGMVLRIPPAVVVLGRWVV